MSSEDKTECALVVPVCEAGRLETQRETIAETLAELDAEVRELRRKLNAGEVNKKDVGLSLSDLRYWLKALRETEAELETIRRKESGIAESYGLDLEAAELEVWCRMARLKDCGGAG